jgi:16S rRNA (cytidine1402-2'-O)-methyltransferase
VSRSEENLGVLWIVATPIGAIGDLSPRAREVLSQVERILAEDTRRARSLLSSIELPARGRLQSLHEHNEERQVRSLIDTLRRGESMALISDAGTPVLSDPGYVLVRAAIDAGVRVCSVPGASSFTAAIAASGQPPLPATLCGFLPARKGPRQRRISELDSCPWTLVILMSPHRLGRELADLAEILGRDRGATLLAEISKFHERAIRATLGELAECAEVDRPRGEYIVVVGPSGNGGEPTQVDEGSVRSAYRSALSDGLERRDALRKTARQFGLQRRQVFDLLIGDHGNELDDHTPPDE